MIADLTNPSAGIVPRGNPSLPSPHGRPDSGSRDPELCFGIPAADREEFDALPEVVREEIVALLGIFRSAARVKVRSRIFRASRRPGRSVKTLERKWLEFSNAGGDWRALINRAKVPAGRSLPREFVEFIQGWFSKNKRVARSQYLKFIRFWQQGCDDKGRKFSVPGYGTREDWAARQHRPTFDLPPGWSYANLMRQKYRLSKAQEKMAREGTNAARSLVPHILGTRKGLRFLEEVTFDDVKCDFRVIDPKSGEICDLWLLVAFDRASAVCLGYGMRPARVREDGTQEHLKLIDMKQLAGWVLERWGLPGRPVSREGGEGSEGRDGYTVTWKLENGCATFPEATAMALRDLSGGAIQVSYARMLGGISTAGYKERALGNSRGKASHEAHNNLLHNMAGDLPGQTGRRWDVRPADLGAREKEARDIFAVAERLTPERRKEMRYPVLTLAQAREELNRIFDQMNSRTVHELEGFEEVVEWRPQCGFPSGPWRPIATLPVSREGGEGSEGRDVETRTRMESPYERMRRLTAGMDWRRVPRSTLIHFYEETQRIVSVNERGEIEFTHEKRDLVFCSAPQPSTINPQPGTKFLAYFHPQEPDFLHLTRLAPHKGYVATWVRRERVRSGDAAALQAAFQYTGAALKAQTEHLARVTAGERAELEEMRESNARLIDEAAADMNAVAPASPTINPPTLNSQPSEVAAALDAARGQIQRSRFNEQARAREEQSLADLATDLLSNNNQQEE